MGELEQPRQRRQPKPHKFAYWQWKTVSLHALHVHFSSFDILKTFSFFLRREMTCFAVVDDVSIWWQMFNFVFLSPKCWFQFNSRIVTTHFSNIMSLNNWKMIAETRSHIFRWRSRFRRRRVCLSSLILLTGRWQTLLWDKTFANITIAPGFERDNSTEYNKRTLSLALCSSHSSFLRSCDSLRELFLRLVFPPEPLFPQHDDLRSFPTPREHRKP